MTHFVIIFGKKNTTYERRILKRKKFVAKVSKYIDTLPYLKEDKYVYPSCTEWRNWKYITDDSYIEIDVFDLRIRYYYGTTHDENKVIEYKSIDKFKKNFNTIINLIKQKNENKY